LNEFIDRIDIRYLIYEIENIIFYE